MNGRLLIHIPHNSLKLPKIFFDNIIVSKSIIKKENVFISDYHIIDFIPEKKCKILKADYSRLFCDVERFKENELMEKYGMGIIYNKLYTGETFIKYDNNYKNSVLAYYDSYHNKLDNMVKRIIDKYKVCYIIDLHSFSKEFVKRIFNYDNCPDICLGIENGTDKYLLDLTINHFKEKGLNVMINYPYKGSIMPNMYFNSNKISTLMIEINKDLYLNNDFINNEKFNKLKKIMNEYYEKVNNYLKEF